MIIKCMFCKKEFESEGNSTEHISEKNGLKFLKCVCPDCKKITARVIGKDKNFIPKPAIQPTVVKDISVTDIPKELPALRVTSELTKQDLLKMKADLIECIRLDQNRIMPANTMTESKIIDEISNEKVIKGENGEFKQVKDVLANYIFLVTPSGNFLQVNYVRKNQFITNMFPCYPEKSIINSERLWQKVRKKLTRKPLKIFGGGQNEKENYIKY